MKIALIFLMAISPSVFAFNNHEVEARLINIPSGCAYGNHLVDAGNCFH